MEGVRLVVNKGLSNHFQVSHTITLSTLGDSGYRFGSTYVGSKQTGPTEVGERPASWVPVWKLLREKMALFFRKVIWQVIILRLFRP